MVNASECCCLQHSSHSRCVLPRFTAGALSLIFQLNDQIANTFLVLLLRLCSLDSSFFTTTSWRYIGKKTKTTFEFRFCEHSFYPHFSLIGTKGSRLICFLLKEPFILQRWKWFIACGEVGGQVWNHFFIEFSVIVLLCVWKCVLTCCIYKHSPLHLYFRQNVWQSIPVSFPPQNWNRWEWTFDQAANPSWIKWNKIKKSLFTANL